MSDINITEEQVDSIVLDLISRHSDDLEVNEQEFVDLLRYSLSLNVMEKKRVIDAAPTLSQFQFDELKKVFLEEREKFKELAKEHPEDIKKLVFKQQEEWIQLGELYQVAEAANEAASEEAQKIDDLKAQFGL